MIVRRTWNFVATRHGTYTITVEVEAPVGAIDAAELDVAWQAIRPVIADHDADLVKARHITEGRADRVADFLLREFAGELDYGGVHVEAVTVAEAPDTSVTARREVAA